MAGAAGAVPSMGEPVIIGEPVEDSPHGKFRRELIFPEKTQMQLRKISRDLQHDTEVLKELKEQINGIHKPRKRGNTVAMIVAAVAGTLALFLFIKYRTWRP